MLQKSFVAIKPTAVKRGLIGRILQRFEDKQYKIVAMKIIIPLLPSPTMNAMWVGTKAATQKFLSSAQSVTTLPKPL